MTFYISHQAPFGGPTFVTEYETLEEAQEAYDSNPDLSDEMWAVDEDGYNEDWGEPVSDYVFSPT